jgi:lysophospholipase L1-like esterase
MSKHRIRIAAALALTCGLAPAASASGAVTFRWSVPERLAGDGVAGVARTVDAAARITTAIELRTCVADPTWTLDGEPVDVAPAGRCRFALDLGDGDPHELVLSSGADEVRATVRARDLLVVTIGDSVSSGEGNPDGPSLVDPRWLERRCHRSMRSGAAQSALALEAGSPRSAVTLFALGCSGATVPTGLLGPYAGVEPSRRRGDLPPQLDELDALQARRPVDAVLVSVGANDVHFGPIARFCISVSRCETRRFDPGAPGHQAAPGTPAADAVIAAALSELPARYDALAARLRAAGIAPERVVIVEYFDPTHDEHGETCRAALPGITQDEAAWASDAIVTPLNTQVRLAALRHGWHLVSGVQDAFLAHGICARGQARWVRRIEESLGRGSGLSGPLHPNGLGHLATAALISPALAATVGEETTGGAAQAAGRTDDENTEVPWWLLPIAAAAGLAVGLTIRRRKR